jgi:hypothetical protein
MTQNDYARMDGYRNTFRDNYFQLSRFLSNRFKDINAGELVIPAGLGELYTKELIWQYGSATKRGRLQKELDRDCPYILKDLKQDFPYFTGTQIQVFSYIAAGLPYYLIAKLSGLSSVHSVWVMKTKMVNTISFSNCLRKEEYLLFLAGE